jgi:hypothetical protein
MSIMSFYHLINGQHKELDTIMGRFFGQGGRGSKNFKYHMAKWDSITIPSDFGGIGIISTRRPNDFLAGKMDLENNQ